MIEPAARGYYVTGTDTGVGKTYASVALIHALRAAGRTVVGMKPVASGCDETPEGLRNSDALALQAASLPRPCYGLTNPFALREPTAPQIAAQMAGIRVSLPPIISAYRHLCGQADMVVVEGVGGWLAPLADGLEQSQLARALELPVILVVGMKLGCLNHARLSEQAIRADGLPLAGWIGNFSTGNLDYRQEYERLLAHQLEARCLGFLAHDPNADARQAAATLRLPVLA